MMVPGRNLKILFIPRWFPNRVDPFNGIFIKRHALAVSSMHRVAVLYVNADPVLRDKVYELESAVEDNLSITRVYYNNSCINIPVISTFIKFFRYLKACRMGIKVIHEKFGTPDITHIHVLARTFLPAYYFKYFYKTPYIVSEQWSGYLPEDGMYKGFLKKLLTKIAIRKASAVTVVSESLRQGMLSHGLQNTYSVIPNVVDTHLFYPRLNNEKKDKFILLHVSNLDDRAKNVSGMIRAAQKISVNRNDFEFRIVGDGPQRTMLETLAENLGLLNKTVFFLGTRMSAEVAEIMRQADLFLLFSNYDNMPCVMVESLATGLPVLGSAIHGIKEHIKEGKGILVSPGDENALGKAILHAMNNISSFEKVRLNEYAKGNFSYEAVAKQFDVVYQKVIQK